MTCYDPYYQQVVLLTLLNQGGGYNDLSVYDHTLTPLSGNFDETIPYYESGGVFGDGSYRFENPFINSASRFEIPYSEAFLLSSQFTIEFFIYITSGKFGLASVSSEGVYGWTLEMATTDIRIYDGGGNGVILGFSPYLSTNTWMHVAVCANAGDYTVYVGGVSKGGGTNDGPLLHPSGNIFMVGYAGGSSDFYGNVNDIRITDGVQRYTETFTPPDEHFCFPNGNLSGKVYERNSSGVMVPGAYPVKVYDREMGNLYASTTSGADGAYSVNKLWTSREYYVMALDNSSPIQRSAIVDKVVAS